MVEPGHKLRIKRLPRLDRCQVATVIRRTSRGQTALEIGPARRNLRRCPGQIRRRRAAHPAQHILVALDAGLIKQALHPRQSARRDRDRRESLEIVDHRCIGVDQRLLRPLARGFLVRPETDGKRAPALLDRAKLKIIDRGPGIPGRLIRRLQGRGRTIRLRRLVERGRSFGKISIGRPDDIARRLIYIGAGCRSCQDAEGA